MIKTILIVLGIVAFGEASADFFAENPGFLFVGGLTAAISLGGYMYNKYREAR